MRTLSSLLQRTVVTESGDELGRCRDFRGEVTTTSVRITGICVGRSGILERLGIGSQQHLVIPWDAVTRIDGSRIVIRDGTKPAPHR